MTALAEGCGDDTPVAVGYDDLVMIVHDDASMVTKHANGQEPVIPLWEDVTVQGRVGQAQKWVSACVRGANYATISEDDFARVRRRLKVEKLMSI